MKTLSGKHIIAAITSLFILTVPSINRAEDIDLFVGGIPSASYNPNVLIVIDNSSNWARSAQHWPGGIQQGQSEARAIKNVISGLNDKINVGLMEHPTLLSAMDAGWIRQAVVPMSVTNISSFSGKLDTIYNNILNPTEKTDQNIGYGGMLFDSFKYYGGYTSPAHATDNVAGTPVDRTHFGPDAFALPSDVPTTLADTNGYSVPYTAFKSPITAENNCGKNFVIFIANNANNMPTDDPALLSNVGCSTARIARPNLTQSTDTITGTVGNTASCYASASACTTAAGTEFPAQCGPDNNSYESCACTAAVEGAPTCGTGQLYYSVLGSRPAGDYPLGYASACVPTVNQCSTADFAAQCATYDGGCTCGPSYITTGCGTNQEKYQVIAHQLTSKSSVLGYTSSCYADAATCTSSGGTTPYAAQCATFPGGCSCGTPATETTACASGSSRYTVTGSLTMLKATPTGTFTTPSDASYADNWARCLYQTDVSPVTGQQNVTTFVLDVYKDQQNAGFTSMLMSMAKQGGGKYFAATSEQAIIDALKEIFTEIQGVNSVFASASLPVNATNRSQNENQVYIGMFRPDADAKPRWFGNLKRYQLIKLATGVELGDVSGKEAVNSQTGFIHDCAASYWTSDSDAYWQNVAVNPPPIGKCTTDPYNDYSDAPDGPQVEKGAVAEVLRKGNNPPTTDTTPTWAVNRTVKTASMASFTDTTLGSTAEAIELAKFTLGHDVKDERANENLTETRPSIHGDVVHSRPLPINYGGTAGVKIFYGANDGTLRAVDADTGKELWAYIAPEHYGKLQRLLDNQPLIDYPNTFVTPPTPAPLRKDYFFDGSIGVYQTFSGDVSDTAWIFPTMRRGGRMVYAFDVSTPSSPGFKWKVGCPNPGDDAGCSAGTSDIGQTWSIPAVAKIKGYSTTSPVIVMGGGYDACEDANSSTPTCASAKGKKIFILAANDGTMLASFDTERSVAADVAMVDVDYDGYVDYAYAADLGGNIYRVNFIDPSTKEAFAKDSWASRKVAFTKDSGRKFFYPPAVMPAANKVYLALGSGDREHPLQSHYPYNNIVNRFYVYLDDPSVNTAIDLDSAANSFDYSEITTCETEKLLPSSTKRAWFMDLNCPNVSSVDSCPATPGCGEQTVTSAIIAGGMAAFSTNSPVHPSPGACTNALGCARGYWVNLFNASGAIGVEGNCGGTRASGFTGGGLPPSPVLGTVPIDGKPVTVCIGCAQKAVGPSEVISPGEIKTNPSRKRRLEYWKSSGDN